MGAEFNEMLFAREDCACHGDDITPGRKKNVRTIFQRNPHPAKGAHVHISSLDRYATVLRVLKFSGAISRYLDREIQVFYLKNGWIFSISPRQSFSKMIGL